MTDLCPVCGNRPADPAICGGCRLHVAADLHHIRHHHRTLTAHLMPGGNGTPSRAVPASRPPLAVGPLSLVAKGGIGGILGSWVQLLLEEDRIGILPDHRLTPTAYTDLCGRLLDRHLDWLLDQPFADALATELHDLRRDIDIVLGLNERTWMPLPGRWTCPLEDCTGTLIQKLGEALIRCPDCGERWDGEAQVERLGLLLGCEFEVTIDQAAALAKVHRATVYRWIEVGALPTVGDGKTIDKRDLVVLTIRRTG